MVNGAMNFYRRGNTTQVTFDCQTVSNKTAKKMDTVFFGFWLTDFIESNILVI